MELPKNPDCNSGKPGIFICYCIDCHQQMLEDIAMHQEEVASEAEALGWSAPDFCQECGEDYCECDSDTDDEEE